MTTADVVPAFLTVCPAIAPAWRDNLAFWGDETNRGHYNDVGVIAQHLVDSFERDDTAEICPRDDRRRRATAGHARRTLAAQR